MRDLAIIFLAMFLGSCVKINELKIAGEKVTKSVNASTEATKNVCNEDNESSVTCGNQLYEMEADDTKASTSWDTRMMLW